MGLKRLHIVGRFYVSRNILNNEVIDNFINRLLARGYNDNVQKWIKNKLRSYYYNEFDDVVRIDENIFDIISGEMEGDYWYGTLEEIGEYFERHPEKKNILERGGEIYFFPSYDLSEEKLITEEDLQEKTLVVMNKYPDKKFNFTTPFAANDWAKEMTTVNKDLSIKENWVKEILKVGNYTWYQILNAEMCKVEGEQMQNCIKDYNQNRLEQPGFKLFSLRDKNFKPHVNAQILGSELNDLKGKQNSYPDEKYMEAVRELIENQRVDAISSSIIHEHGYKAFEREIGIVFSKTQHHYISVEKAKGETIKFEFGFNLEGDKINSIL